MNDEADELNDVLLGICKAGGVVALGDTGPLGVAVEFVKPLVESQLRDARRARGQIAEAVRLIRDGESEDAISILSAAASDCQGG